MRRGTSGKQGTADGLRWPWTLALAVSSAVVACGDTYDDPPPVPDRYEIFVDPLPASTDAGSIFVSGIAECDACPSSESQFGGCPVILGPFASGIDIHWNNATTGATGAAAHMIQGACVCLFSACWTVYEHAYGAIIPLTIGVNTIEVAASGPDKKPGIDTVEIVRLPPAPASISAQAVADGIEVLWTPVAGADSYELYWSDRPIVDLARAQRVVGATSPWSHTLLPDEATFHYAVVAVQQGWSSAPSADAWATTGWRFETVPVLAPAERGDAIGIAVDGAGSVHIHTTRSTGPVHSPEYRNEYARCDAGAWTMLPVADVQGPGAGIGIDAASTPHLGWMGTMGPVHAYQSVGGWTTESVDQPSTCAVEFALDDSGASHFVHAVRTASTPIVEELRHVTNRSGTWTRTVVAQGNYGCASAGQSALVVDAGRSTHIAWLGGYPDGGVLYATDRSGSWTTELVASGSQSGLALAVDAMGEPLVALCGPERELRLARRARDGSWAAEVVDAEVWSNSISLLVDGAGVAHLAYTSWPIDPTRPDGLYHATLVEGAWRPVAIHPGFADRTVLAAGPDGRVHLGWLQGAAPMLSRRL